MSQWIFVIKDDESVFDKRIKNKSWPIYPGTKFQTFLEIGDAIVFYQAGQHAQKFLGTAVVNSDVKSIPDKIDHYLNIDRIDVWKNPLSIRGMLSQLSFIVNLNNWGLHMQGGILKLNENDYSIILKAAKKLTLKKTD